MSINNKELKKVSKAYSSKMIRVFVVLSILIFGIIEWAIVYFCYPQYYTPYMLCITPYFLVLGITVLAVVTRLDHKHIHPGRAIARLMLVNAAQFLLSIVFMGLYVYLIDDHRDAFLLTFGIFYIVFMFIKFFVLYNIDHHHKMDVQRLKNEKKNK